MSLQKYPRCPSYQQLYLGERNGFFFSIDVRPVGLIKGKEISEEKKMTTFVSQMRLAQ